MRESIHRIAKSRLWRAVLFCLLTLGILAYASAVLKPTRSLLRGEAGAAWDGFLRQPDDTIDVVFFGNSHVFDGVDPSEIWRSAGIPSYVMAGPVQPLTMTRHYVAEVLKTQKPKVVALDMSVITYNERNYVREFQLINVGYMPWGAEKLRAVFADTPKTDRTAALVDLWAYHSRWSELKPADLKVTQRNPGDSFLKGFQVVSSSRPVTPTAEGAPKQEKASILAAEKRNADVLREIIRMCDARDIEVLLFLNPTAPTGVYTPALDRVKAELGDEFDNVTYLDLSGPDAVPGLSYKTDFFDGGHLSTFGAKKSSNVLARFLSDTYGLPDRRGEAAYAQWARDVRTHDAYIAKVWGARRPE